MAGVRVGLEANQVGAEHAVEDLFAAGEATEDLTAREGGVDEEADDDIWNELTQEPLKRQKGISEQWRGQTSAQGGDGSHEPR